MKKNQKLKSLSRPTTHDNSDISSKTQNTVSTLPASRLEGKNQIEGMNLFVFLN